MTWRNLRAQVRAEFREAQRRKCAAEEPDPRALAIVAESVIKKREERE
jgi:hypothetical protein